MEADGAPARSRDTREIPERRDASARLLAWLVLLATASQAWLFLRLYRDRGAFLADDAYISFRYARRWADGLGLTWNDGMWVEGFSNPLWTLTLGALARVGPEPHETALWLALACFLAVPLVLAALARRLGLGLLPAAILILGPALDVGLGLWSSSGLETAQTTLLVALWLLAAAHSARPGRGLAAFGLLTGALLLSRPEAPLWAGVAGVWLLAARRVPAVAFAGWSVLALAPALAYLAFRWTHYGALLPNTFYAKVEWTPLTLAHGVGTLLGWAIAHAVPLAVAAACLWLGRGRPLPAPARALGPLAIGAVLAQAFFVLAVGGDWMGHSRFLAPLLPAFYLAVALAATRLRVRQPAAPRTLVPMAALLLLHATLGHATRDRLDDFVPTARRAGLWLKDVASPTDRLATTAAGALPYFSGLWTYDIHGLNHPDVRSWSTHRGRAWTLGHNRYDLEHLFELRPEWIVWIWGTERNRRRMERLRERAPLPRERLSLTDAFLTHPALRELYRIEDAVPRSIRRSFTVFRVRTSADPQTPVPGGADGS